jgi:tartrate-resistant acid phosphatase type 5
MMPASPRRTVAIVSLIATLALPSAATVLGEVVQAAAPAATIAAPATTTIAVIGDFGMGNAAEGAVASLVASWTPDAVLAVGDDYYAPAGGSGLDRYDRSIGQFYCAFLSGAAPGSGCPSGGTSATNRFWPVTGNHDYSDGGIDNYTGYFALPGNERTYSVTLGPVEVLAIDSQAALADPAEMSAQRAWLESAVRASTAAWQVVILHHPPYSSGLVHGSTAAMQWPYADWGVDLVLAGHDHTYERVEANGITYVVDGLGGASRYRFGAPVAGSVARYDADWGALRLVASEAAIDGEFISTDGTVQDSFRLENAVVPSSPPSAAPSPDASAAPSPSAPASPGS